MTHASRPLWQHIVNPEDRDALQRISAERQSWLGWKPFTEIRELMPQLPQRQCALDVSGAEVIIGPDLAEDDPERQLVERAARAILPWKKGPYRLLGIPIDAEWRSDYKWDRLKTALPDQAGNCVLDVGSNNGYYLFRLLDQQPQFLLGIDPVPRIHYQFHLLQHFAQVPNLAFEMWGWQELVHLRASFDTIFCMGILYHHPDPMALLRSLYEALKPGGLLVMESIVLADKGDLCLFPKDRYARMRNVFFVPSVSAMANMLERSRFKQIETINCQSHKPEEQRTTPWNPGPSYENFLDRDDPNLTEEGYPAPHRAIMLARR